MHGGDGVPNHHFWSFLGNGTRKFLICLSVKLHTILIYYICSFFISSRDGKNDHGFMQWKSTCYVIKF